MENVILKKYHTELRKDLLKKRNINLSKKIKLPDPDAPRIKLIEEAYLAFVKHMDIEEFKSELSKRKASQSITRLFYV